MAVEAIGEDFPGNSYNAKSSGKKNTKSDNPDTPTPEETIPEKRNEKVVSGEVVRKKKGVLSKFKETFTGEDAHSVGSFVFFEVVVPAIKTTVSDAISQGVERMLFGDSRGGSRSSGSSRSTTYTPYNRMYRGRESEQRPRHLSPRGRSTHSFDEIIMDSRGEAEEVLDRLTENVREFGVATVSDLYDLVGISKDYTDYKWGWANLRDARVRRVREGYLLDLPSTEPID